MKIKTILFFAVFFTCTIAYSQEYQVSSVIGDVTCLKEGEWIKPAIRSKISENDKVRIGKNSSLSVLNRSKKTLYALKTHKEDQLKEIIKSQNNSTIGKFSDTFIQSLTRGETERISHEAGVVYKNISMDRKIYASLKKYIAEKEAGKIPTSPAYSVSMALIDCETGEEIKNTGTIGTNFFFQVTNNSTKPLYINVLDIASDGSYYDCMPIDNGGTMLHLLVPAQSTVDFPNYPMEFAEPKGKDELILIACDMPFDLRNVIECFTKDLSVNPISNIGFYTTTIDVK